MVEKGSDSDILEGAADGSTAVLSRNARLQSEAFQNAILTSARLAAMATDASGTIQLFNVGAERMLGYTATEVVNRFTVVDLLDQQELTVRARAMSLELSTTIAPNFEAMICKAPWAAEDCYESTLIRKNRERVPVAISITVLRDDIGSIIGYTLIATDISATKQVGFERYEASSAAPQGDFNKYDLLTCMSHEMRTPLGAILGFAQLMDSGNPSPTILQKRNIDRILQAGWYLEKLINITHDLALIESETLVLSLESLPLSAVMLDCQAMIEPQAEIRGVRVTFPVFDTPCSVSADRIRVQEVLCSLLAAAIENSDVDGAVVVSCESSPDWIRTTINYGSDASFADRLSRHFQPYDGHEQKPTAMDGTGLNLLLARRLVELMGGAIGASSTDGPRNLFSFDLKSVLVPNAVGDAATHSVVGEDEIAKGRRPQSPFYSAVNHGQQH